MKNLISKKEWQAWQQNPVSKAFFGYIKDALEAHKDILCYGGVDLQVEGPKLIGRIEVLREIMATDHDGYLAFYGVTQEQETDAE